MEKIPNEHFFAWAAEELYRNGKIRFRVKGKSMHPLLRDQKDEVSLRLYREEPLRKGDIVLFKYHGQHILHRFISQKNGYFQMQGDNVCGHSEQCRKTDVIGIVVNIYRRKSTSNISAYKVISPHSPKWKIITLVWRAGCRIYATLQALKRKLFR